jgi:expansin (peptidoglycan-binding protein)
MPAMTTSGLFTLLALATAPLSTVAARQTRALRVRGWDSGSNGGNQGDLTYYGGAGKGGACTSTYVPTGFKTVALNAPQYGDGEHCGSCVSACFTANGKKTCFEAIIDNKCPECKSGDLDMGENGDGRWPLSWSFMPCPSSGGLKSETQGSNDSYGKVKVTGGPSAISDMVCDGTKGSSTPDGYFEFHNSGGFCGTTLKCTCTFSSGGSDTVDVNWC